MLNAVIAKPVSYFFEILTVPAYAYRLMQIRRLDRRARYQIRLSLRQELATFRFALAIAERMESEAAECGLILPPVQDLADDILALSLIHLKRRVRNIDVAQMGGE